MVTQRLDHLRTFTFIQRHNKASHRVAIQVGFITADELGIARWLKN